MASEANDNVVEISPAHDKAIRLFTYLKDLCALRTTQVRNVATYDQVVWLRDLPRNKLCRCAAWRLIDPQTQIAEQPSDLWIEVRKPNLKSPPELPDELEPWVKDEELANSLLSEPGFYEQIPLSEIQEDAANSSPDATVSLNAYPHLFDMLVAYIETKWKPWAIEDRELQKVQKAYNQLFNIYQRQEKLGEQYEVIIGAGLLLWKSPSSGEIKRHIIAIPARIEFDRVRGIMSVGPMLDGPQLTLECTMLETADRPNPTDLTGIENDVVTLDGDPWDVANLERVLRGFANALPATGDFNQSFEHAGGTSTKPIVNLAPALILRKRTRRTFEDFYRQIIEQVKEGGEIPENIRRIIEIVDDAPDGNNADAVSTMPEQTDTELYFPLPANDEQRRIIQKVECRRGVLVQGPPGTGKSHTIANLIAHYLAKGKRVLVTSETPRALEVLRRKLPCEIEELCVVWLGSGPESQKALEKSVLGITQRKANWDASYELGQIDNFVLNLDAERKKQARLRHDLRACRESDVYVHSNIFGRYSGTLQQIAVQINQESDRFQWFIDRPKDVAEPALTSDDLLKMAQIRRKMTPELTEQLKYSLFPQDQLVQPDEFCRLVNAEKKADLAHREAEVKRAYPGYGQLSALDREKRRAIKDIVESILATQDNLSKCFLSWAERASHEIAGDQDRIWRHILTSTVDHVNHIERLLNENGTLEVAGLDDNDLRLVSEHATALKDHLEKGKGLGFWFIRTRTVKVGLYLVKSVTVNGKPCNNPDILNQLLVWVEISARIQALADLWKAITAPPTGDATLQCPVYRDLCEPIERALVIHDLIEKVRTICSDCSGISFPSWHIQDEVKALYKALDALDIEEDFIIAQRVFAPLSESLDDFVSHGHAHTSTEQLRKAVSGRDCTLYCEAFETLSSLLDWAEASRLANDVHERFCTCASSTCDSYDASYSDQAWDERFIAFEAAWFWAKTDRWLDEVSDRERPKQIQRELENSELRVRDALKNLAASKAWQHCMKNLGERERMALVAWHQAVASIRGGTGRYAEGRRETARQKLEECRKAIPAWVMPLYQVVQTIRPQGRQFDIVIIDEASQSGPEALLLNYIADKIIVVGDDKQITPMHVGVDLDQVQYLQRKYLQDIPHKETLGLDSSSLFSQAALRFPDRIRLREHFRCMPEIIQFSNNLSYENEPLIPLRQYGADRLEPLQTVFVKDGYRTGSSDEIENPPEAEAIVSKIAECCENPAYARKSFGVICLKGGNRQADLINSLLVKEIGAEEMERRSIICGRAYDFQGDERNVIFLSMVDALSDGHIRCDMNNPDVQRRYNVATSRAQDQLWLFHSMTLNDLKPGSYQYRLLEYCQNPKVCQPEPIGDTTVEELRRMSRDNYLRQETSPQPFGSWFEVDVFLKIVDRGYRVLPQYPVNERRIDLVVEGLRGRLAVECHGDKWHGADKYEADMCRQRELGRCGWTFCIIWGSNFYRNPDVALADLWNTLENLKILPRHLWDADRKQAVVDATSEIRNSIEDFTENDSERIEEETHDDNKVELSLADGEHGRLNQALKYTRSRRCSPEELPPIDIQNAIVQSLKKCPNHTCTLKSLTSRALKEMGVQTRGNPRLEFEKRVMRNLGALKRKGIVEEYKAKNKRIRLLETSQKTLAF